MSRDRISTPQTNRHLWKYHLIALVTQLVWSTTFVSTKVLLNHGMSPANIFLFRFTIAYLGILIFSHKRLWADSLKDETMLILAGLTGGSLYFLTENTALQYTFAINVSILISTTPLFTLALSAIVFRHRLRKTMFIGSLIALSGVIMVIFNGHASFDISPKGDLLVIAAAICWAAYSVIMKYFGDRHYPPLFITRKVFFYGVASMIFYYPFSGNHIDWAILAQPPVYGNILFLGVVASLICFAIFTKVVDAIGPDKAANYIYLSPLGAIATAVIFLHEPLSWMAACGALITISGVIIVERTK